MTLVFTPDFQDCKRVFNRRKSKSFEKNFEKFKQQAQRKLFNRPMEVRR